MGVDNIRKQQKLLKREDGTESPPGLWDAIRAKKERGEPMRTPGSKGAPTDKAIRDSQKG